MGKMLCKKCKKAPALSVEKLYCFKCWAENARKKWGGR